MAEVKEKVVLPKKNPWDKSQYRTFPKDSKDIPVKKEMSNDEFFEISHKLEQFHSIFYKFWEMGKPVFTSTLPTAAVSFDPKSGKPLQFLFNPEFWDGLDENTRLFIICHEMLHIVFNHGVRIKGSDQKQLANACLDVVVNHILIDNFNFKKSKVIGSDDLCWIETVFDDNPGYNGPKVELKKAFEYYYSLALKHFPKVSVAGKGGKGEKGEGGSGEGKGEQDKDQDKDKDNGESKLPNLVDDHDIQSESQFEDLLEEMNEILSDEEKEDFRELIEQNFQKEENEEGGDSNSPGGKQAGNQAGNIWTFANVNKVRKKKKWETIIKRWAFKTLNVAFRDIEQWSRINRRFAIIGKDDQMLIPTEMEEEDMFLDEKRIEVYFFLDTSGSCAHLKDRFFKAAMTLPEKRFKLRLFCFDTRVYDVSIEEKKLYGFGGTRFDIMEEKIQSIISGEKVPYPKAVFVISDGAGTAVTPAFPKNWYWFLSENYKHCIPTESHTFMLKDFE